MRSGRNLEGRPIEALIDLPLMTDPELLAAMAPIVCPLGDPAYVTDQNLLCLELCRAVNLGIRARKYAVRFAHACGYLGWPARNGLSPLPQGFRLARTLGATWSKSTASPRIERRSRMRPGIAAIWTQPMATAIEFIRDANSHRRWRRRSHLPACYAM